MVGKKIKYYRLKKGITLEELAKEVGCTKAAISLYENEEREPSLEVRKVIAKALGISWVELCSRDSKDLFFNHVSFRKKQKASKKDIDLLKMDIETRCASRIALMNIVGLINFVAFKPKKLSFESSVSDNAKEIRTALKLPISGPIYSITNVLERAGIIVLSFECDEQIDGVNGFVNNIPYIFFNCKNKTIERQRFTIAHELCHLFFNNSVTNQSEKDIEKYINQVAGNVLIPTSDLYAVFGRTNRNITPFLRNSFAVQYKVAPSCLLNRLLEAGIITEMYYKNYFIFLNKTCGRKGEKTLLDCVRDSEMPTIFTQQVYLALSEELISMSKAAEFLNVPLYEVIQNMRAE